MNQEMPTFDPAKFRIVMPSTTSAPSTAEVRVAQSVLNFSFVTAVELNYPKMVTMLISDDGKRLLLQNALKGEQSIPFFDKTAYNQGKSRQKSQKAIPVRHKNLVKVIRESMDWNAGVFAVPGLRYDNGVILFDMTLGERVVKGAQKRPLSTAEILASFPPLQMVKQANYTAIPLLPAG